MFMTKPLLFAALLSLLLPGSSAATDKGETPTYYPNTYFPGTELLAEDEMRITALGTGMPAARRAQASAGWFVELGNGQNFMFDVGTGSMLNFPMLKVPYRDADKLFLSHLHTDHAGDFNLLWVGGWISGRHDRPLRVWGPNGSKPALGTKAFVEAQQAAWAWDVTSRHGKFPAAGAEITVYEFDFAKTQTVYDENEVRITSFPALHIMDGPVSYKLEWNGLSFVFSGDTSPNKFFIENAKGADILIHETFQTVNQMVEQWGWDRATATVVGTVIHTSPAQAGKIFSLMQPRLAVGYHFINNFNTEQEVYDEVRTTYGGPLVLAKDRLVFNVTPEKITKRMMIAPPYHQPEVMNTDEFANQLRKKNTPASQWLLDSRLDLD